MATKTKGKNADVAKAHPPGVDENGRFNANWLEDDIFDAVHEALKGVTGFNGQLTKQQRLVDDLRRKLEAEEKTLRELAAPALKLHAVIKSVELAPEKPAAASKKKAAPKKKPAAKRKAPAAVKPKPAGKAGPVVPAGPADRPGPARAKAVKSEKKKYLSGAEKRRRKAEREKKAVSSQPLAVTGPGDGPARASKGAAKFGAHQGLKSAGPAAAAVRELEQIVQKAGEGSLSKLLNCAKPGAPMSAPWAAALHLPEGHPLRAKRVATGGDVGKACEQCDCTYRDECEGGCYWVDLDDPDRWLCNRCAADVPARGKAAGPVERTGPADRPGPARNGAVNSDEVPAAIAKRAARYNGPPSKLVNGAVH